MDVREFGASVLFAGARDIPAPVEDESMGASHREAFGVGGMNGRIEDSRELPGLDSTSVVTQRDPDVGSRGKSCKRQSLPHAIDRACDGEARAILSTFS